MSRRGPYLPCILRHFLNILILTLDMLNVFIYYTPPKFYRVYFSAISMCLGTKWKTAWILIRCFRQATLRLCCWPMQKVPKSPVLVLMYFESVGDRNRSVFVQGVEKMVEYIYVVYNTYSLSMKIVLLSCQPRVTVTSCFVYKVISDFYLIDHLCINPIHRIGSIHK